MDRRLFLAVATCFAFTIAAEGAEPVRDALDEVNASRARFGLHPFRRDDRLFRAASGAAAYRASRGIRGHTPNDFAYLPAGAVAKATGCAALGDEWGWQSCCTFEPWQYAGAAWVRGRDGRRYMHLFVR